jgi:cobalt-precorrin-5B (C1)-methyltransferase
MKREAFKMFLKPGCKEEYKRRHANLFPELKRLLSESGVSLDISGITLARELWERLSADSLNRFTSTVLRHCYDHCCPLLPDGELELLLIDDNGNIFGV